VFNTEVGTQLDQQFKQWIEHHREEYADTIFMEDLAAELEDLDDEEEVERRIELWIDNRNTQLSEQGEIHSNV
ncbi:hypothetical protein, partial [Halorubrum sp. SP3]